MEEEYLDYCLMEDDIDIEIQATTSNSNSNIFIINWIN